MQSFPIPSTHNCLYCATQFDAAQRTPYFICNNNHQICLQCLNSLQNPNNCKVCRLPIDFTKIRPNRELVQILANAKNAYYVQQPQGVVYQQNNQALPRQISYDNKQIPYDNNKYPKVGSYSVYNDIKIGNAQPQNYPSPIIPAYQNLAQKYSHHQGSGCISDCALMWHLPAQQKTARTFFYLFLIQVVMSIINMLIAVNGQRSDCLDRRLFNMQITLRKCYFITFYYDLALVVAMLFGFILFHYRCINDRKLDNYVVMVEFISIIKLLVWGAVQIQIFRLQSSRTCNGALYGYQVVTDVFHYATVGTIFFILGLTVLVAGRG